MSNWKIRVQFKSKQEDPTTNSITTENQTQIDKEMEEQQRLKEEREREEKEQEEEMKKYNNNNKMPSIPKISHQMYHQDFHSKRPQFEKKITSKNKSRIPMPNYDFLNDNNNTPLKIEKSNHASSPRANNLQTNLEQINTAEEKKEFEIENVAIDESPKEIVVKRYVKMKRIPQDTKNCVLKWCSWCYLISYHKEMERRLIGRNTYCCLECENETVSCMGCNLSMVRSYSVVADNLCYKCSGIFAKFGLFFFFLLNYSLKKNK